MELILKAAKDAVISAKQTIEYYEKQVVEKTKYKQEAVEKYEQLEKEYNELIGRLSSVK